MATFTEYKEFFDSEVWAEVEETVKDIYDDCMNGLRVASNLQEVKLLQGQLKVCDFFLNLKEAMLEEAKLKQEEKPKEGEQNGWING